MLRLDIVSLDVYIKGFWDDCTVREMCIGLTGIGRSVEPKKND